jgi:hypothetical protein
MPTKITVTNPQPITVKVDSGKDQIVHSTTTFLGSANNFFSNTGGTVTGNIIIEGTTFAGNILPLADQVYNIGSPTLRYKTLFIAANTIDLGGGTISANGNTMILSSPSGGTMFFDAPANTTIDAGAGERAEDTANTAYTLSIGSYYYSGEAIATSNTAINTANTALDSSNAAFSTANTAYDLGLGGYYYSAEALNTANSAIETANVAANTANTSYDIAAGSYYYAATAYIVANDAFVTAQTAEITAQTAIISAQTAEITAQTAINSANLALAIANSIVLTNYVLRSGDTILGPLVFLGEPTANLQIGNIQSANGIDLYAQNTGYAQINYSNIHFVTANSLGTLIQTQNSAINLDSYNKTIDLISENEINLNVNSFNAISVYPNNEIYLRGSIVANVDGGNF